MHPVLKLCLKIVESKEDLLNGVLYLLFLIKEKKSFCL